MTNDEYNPYATSSQAPQDVPPGDHPDRVSRGDILGFLGRHLLVILIVTGISVAATLAVLASGDRSFRATSTLIVESNRSPSLATEFVPDAQFTNSLNTEVEIAKSDDVIFRAVEESAVFERDSAEPSGLRALLSDANLRTDLPPRERWADRISRRMIIRPIPDSSVISLSYADPDPRWAAEIVNAVTSAYLEERLRIFKGDSASDIYAKQITQAEAELAELNAELDAISNGGQLAAAEQLQIALATESAQLAATRLEAQRRQRELAQRYFDDHPELVRAREDIATIERRRGAINAQLADLDERLRRADKIELRLEAARQKFLAARQELDRSALRETADSALTNVRLLQRAKVPMKPVTSPLRTLALAGLFGLVFGVVIAFLREYFAPRRV